MNPVTLSSALAPATESDRWLNWQHRGRAHDRRVARRAKGALTAMVLIVLATMAFYFGR